MLELLSKNNLTKEELEKLDGYLSENVKVMISFLDNEKIIEIINKTQVNLAYSQFLDSLISHLSFEDSFALFIDEDDISYFEKLYDLEKKLNYDYSSLGLKIASYYEKINKKEKVLSLYKEVFKPGFDLSNYDYFDSLERYLEMIETSSSEVLQDLILNSPLPQDYGNDLVNTYLLLISKIDKSDKKYLNFINKALPYARKLARKVQRRKKEVFSDSDEERNLCELLCLKFEYFVHKKDYIKAFDLYEKLTKEIGKSDCVRYYHARDKYYKEMIRLMSNEYREVGFLNDISFTTFEILENIKDINELLNKEITLKKEDRSTYKFTVKHIYGNEVVIAPLLPLVGKGGNIYTIFEEKDGHFYLTNNHR